MAYLASTAAVAVAVGAGGLLSALAPLPSLSLIFLMAVLFSAVSFGIWPAIYASVLSFLAYNFFFLEPLYTLQVAEPHELLALVVFLIVASVTAALAGRVRDQARAATERAHAMQRLYEFTWKLSGLTDVDAIADGAAGEIYTSLHRPTVVLLARDGEVSLSASWPPEDDLGQEGMTAARLSLARNESVGFGTPISPDIRWHFIPLRTQRGIVGVAGVSRKPDENSFDADSRTLLATLTEQTAAAIERAVLAREISAAHTAAESERIRNILLSSVSHDFRTPLAAILGSATSLLDHGDKFDAPVRTGLLQDIKAEAEGLDRLVRNLLSIARIDAGALELRREAVDLREIVERVISFARRRGAAIEFMATFPTDLPLIQADAILVEQALSNVVNNVVLHTPAGTRVTIDAAVTPLLISIRVTDDGPGIPAKLLPQIFGKFVRHGAGQGSGLGLAITSGIVAAHGGSVAAESPVANGRGSRIVLTFPRGEPR